MQDENEESPQARTSAGTDGQEPRPTPAANAQGLEANKATKSWADMMEDDQTTGLSEEERVKNANETSGKKREQEQLNKEEKNPLSGSNERENENESGKKRKEREKREEKKNGEEQKH